MAKYLLLFLAIQLGLFTGQLMRPVQVIVITPFTEAVAAISVWLITLFDSGVISRGVVIQDIDSGFAVAIQAGCNGVEATIVLIAALTAFPSPWKHKLIGMVAGFFAVQALNLIRIISLFYIGQWNRSVFEWAHLYIWQALIMLDVLIIFLIWLRYIPKHANQQRASHAT